MMWHRFVLLAAIAVAAVAGVLGGTPAAWAPLALIVLGWLIWVAVDRQVSGIVGRAGSVGPGRRS